MGQTAHLSAAADPCGLTRARTDRTIPQVPLGRPRVLCLLVACLALAGAASARATTPLAARLARALAVPHVSPSASGAAVLDLGSGKPLYVHNGAAPFAPASNEKLAVTFAVLSALGPSFRIPTDVLGIGQQAGGVWQGDLVLQGHGDPTLSSAGLRGLARRIRAMGIRRVAGAVVGDESWFDARRTAPGWRASFYLTQSPPLSALTVDRARYGRGVSRDPALAAALGFRSALRAAGVGVAGAARTGEAGEDAVTLAEIESPTVAAIVRGMDLESDNFTAELLLKQLGAVQLGKGTSAAGAAVVRRLLDDAGVPLAGVRIVDGSGLSYSDRLTANALVSLLDAMWSDPTLRPSVLHALPVAGVSGTLEDRMRAGPARGAVVAKTGTTSIASALSGFVRDRYAFAVLQNGNPISSWWARRAQDRFATVLAGWTTG
jgi:D-alanyl-D-alanine carboxypeptidase/D-alanyl-D-alanine-endopeptidase (penicillin-binding protein 4)